MNFVWKKNSILFLIILSGFIIMAFVEFPLLNSALKGKEKDFNDKLFYVVRSYEERSARDSALTNAITGDSSFIALTQTTVKEKLDSIFVNNGLPTDYVLAAGRLNMKATALVQSGSLLKSWTSDNLIWTSDSSNNANIIATKLKLAYSDPSGNHIYYVKIFFPFKQQVLMKELLPEVITMVLTLIVLFVCFLMLIAVIKKQRMLAESKAAFVTNMTHELQTPLFTISVASKMLGQQDLIKENHKYSSYIESIQQETGRLMGLVDKVLQISATDKKYFTQNNAMVDMHFVLQSALRRLELIKTERHATVETYFNASPSAVYSNEKNMESVFVNVIDNAIKYAAAGVHIIISTRNEKKEMVISISDNGPGIAPEMKELIFEKFFRAPAGNSHEVRGYGIGLSFAKTVIEAHHGSIKVNSMPGKGSEFVICLPYVNE